MIQSRLNIFNSDFKDFIQALNDNNVDYILVGGYSVVIHGYSRTTGDLDIWVEPTEINYNKLMNAFKHFHLPQSAISLNDFLEIEKNDVFTFGRPPVAIDIMTSIKGVNFKEAIMVAPVYEIQNLPVRVIHLNHLIQSKRAAGRFKDLDDLEHLVDNH